MAQPALAPAVPEAPAQPQSKKPRPEVRKYTEQVVSSFGTPEEPWLVRRWLANHDMGLFAESSFLWEHMRRDDRIRSVIGTRVDAVLGLETGLDAGDEATQAVSDQVQAQTRGVWRGFAGEEEKKQLLHWGLGLGVAYGRIEWGLGEDEWVPRLNIWHPTFLRYDVSSRVYICNALEGQSVVTPGENGWFLWTPYGFKRGWIDGLVRCLAMPWLCRQWAYRDWARYNEVHGLPTTKAKIPRGAQSDDEDRFMSELSNRSSEPTVRLPQDADGTAYDFEIVEATADTWEAFQGMKQEANVDIAVTVLGQNLTTEVQGGSLAAARVQDRVRGNILTSDAALLSAFFNRQVLAPWAAFNLPAGAPVPCFSLQAEQNEDLSSLGDGLTKFGAGVVATKNAGVQLDVDELTRRAGLAVKGPAGEPVAPPAAPAGGQGEPGAGGRGGPPRFNLAASAGYVPTAEETAKHGQEYADEIVEAFTRQGVRAMDQDRLRILACINGAQTLEEMRGMIERMYEGTTPDKLAEVMRLALTEAELNGWYSDRGV
jgi:phage gp29-like protein